jgi:hypothetical protein
MKERVREILTDLERVRENLLALSDDIWLGIDHNDTDALRAGVEFVGSGKSGTAPSGKSGTRDRLRLACPRLRYQSA